MKMEWAEWQQATHLAGGEHLGSKAEGNNPEAQAGKLSGAQGRGAEAKTRALWTRAEARRWRKG